MKMLEFLSIPIILFLVIVAPIWIVMHYRSIKKSSQGLGKDELECFETMLATLDKVNERIETLELILKNDHPNWKKHSASSSQHKPAETDQ